MEGAWLCGMLRRRTEEEDGGETLLEPRSSCAAFIKEGREEDAVPHPMRSNLASWTNTDQRGPPPWICSHGDRLRQARR